MLKSKLLWVLVFAACFGSACRYDMQDQPRYKAYKQSDFYADKRASRDYPEGTVARGMLKTDKALYTGKKDGVDPNAVAQTTVNSAGNTVMTTFPNVVEEFPVPVTAAMIDRGQSRYNIYCGVCHGPLGKGDGMVVRRGFPQPPTYHDDRLRNAPVGHFYDVITNGFGRMSSYSAQISTTDRWAIVAYIRALQISQNPNGTATAQPAASPSPAPAKSPEGGAK